MLAAFEQRWADWNGRPSLGLASWAGGALAALEFAGVRGETVLCPSNTFMATPLAAINAGAEVEFVDCNREDLCMSFDDFEAKAEQHKPEAAFLVHIGGHIAFDSERIAEYCARERDLPDRGLRPRPRRELERPRAGYVRRRRRLLAVCDQDDLDRRGRGARLRQPELIEFARDFRNYGKPDLRGPRPQLPDERVHRGARPGPDRAAARDRRLEERRRPRASSTRCTRPPRASRRDGLGPLQVHRLRPLERSTGRVYDEPCHRIMGHAVDLPNTDWVARNHSCVPLYYRPRAARMRCKADA